MKPVKTFLFEGEQWETKTCRGCKKEFDAPTSTQRTKCRECKLKLNKVIVLRPYKKKQT